MKTLLILAGCLAAALGQLVCPTNWKLVGTVSSGQRCWKYIEDFRPQHYASAASRCKSTYKSYLATLRDSTDTAAYRTMGPANATELWFGLSWVNKSYIWEDGKAWTYRNWKSGEAPTSAGQQCAALYRSTGQWTANISCTDQRPFVCEVPAIKTTCTLERLAITRGAAFARFGTDGGNLRQTVKSYGCSKEVYVKNASAEFILAVLQVYAEGDAYVRLYDLGNNLPLNYYSNTGGSWVTEEYATYAKNIRVEMYASEASAVGAWFSMQPVKCAYGEYVIFRGGYIPTWETNNAMYNGTVTDVSCSAKVTVKNRDNEVVNVAIKVFAGKDAYVRFINADTGAEIKRITNTYGGWYIEPWKTWVPSVKIEVYAPPNVSVAACLGFMASY